MNIQTKSLLLAAFFALFLFGKVQSQIDLAGHWKGVLKISGQELPLIFNFEATEEGWKGSLNNPAQGAKGIPMSKVQYLKPNLTLEINQINARYIGVLVSDTLQGTFSQGGMNFQLKLAKVEAESLIPNRPQNPKGPFEYETIETSFNNLQDGFNLKGTITKPKGMGPFPAVVLVTGSGPQNRNGELMGHQPFWVIADFLTRKGIVVLRYDERGVGKSGGEYNQATTYDFRRDAELALDHLKKYPFVDQMKTGILGHSEGGMIAWMLAAEKKGLGFIVSLAGPVVPIVDLMNQQTKDILEQSGLPEERKQMQMELNDRIYKTFLETQHKDSLQNKLDNTIKGYLIELGEDGEVVEEQYKVIKNAYKNLLTPWYYEFIRFDPTNYVQNANCPALALFGEKDLQVNGKINSNKLDSLKSNGQMENIDIRLYPKMNHLFQNSETGAISEYSIIEETFNEEVMRDIAQWILAQ
ncbi:alpha/beta fold hydrolase [Echinicola jeungdonensis]|uniref:Alpha/beta hydrolase family protein n=1 Tax=Echinicola jeungdonensis TaxID=709343 RepID=A0ABV5J4H6_9BACT|nr:alpha/beta fold hydrolase [Echinicola jeungdonensis]MDN3670582.1 alpha/beta fold hydrolase [Echinicola jeungdonensis]